jgi:uncharacterized protein (DUF924 family)
MHERASFLLEHWFGPFSERASPSPEVRKRWFEKSDEHDALLRKELAEVLEEASHGQHDDWATTAHGRLALVVLLDQITRNIHHGKGAMFKNDARALALAREGIELGHDKELLPTERQFLYMPYMHSESLPVQDRSVALFTELAKDGVDAVEWAKKHRDIVARFRRFPHRNNLLSRTSTGEELIFLQEPGSSF